MKKVIFGIVAVAFLFVSAKAIAAEPTLTLTKTNFSKGEEIILKFTAPKYPKDAWVGIIPSKIKHGEEALNDQNDLTYQYLGGKTKGMLRFAAPNKAGKFDFRMNNSDSNGKEVASTSFVVK